MTSLSTLVRSPTRAGAALFALCASLVGGSFFIQHVLHVEPCPLCIVQRFTYAALAVIFLGVALLGRRAGAQRALLWPALVLVVGGGGVAAYQSQLQLFPPAAAATCSPSLSYMLETLPVGDVVARLFAAQGDCADTSFTVLGLTLAQVSLGIFCALLVALVALLRRRAHTA